MLSVVKVSFAVPQELCTILKPSTKIINEVLIFYTRNNDIFQDQFDIFYLFTLNCNIIRILNLKLCLQQFGSCLLLPLPPSEHSVKYDLLLVIIEM